METSPPVARTTVLRTAQLEGLAMERSDNALPPHLRGSGSVDWRRRSLLGGLAIALLPFGLGCSLFVMAGKMIQGDPMDDSDFEEYSRKSLKEEGKKVAVLCSTPESIKSEFASLDADLLAELSRHLATEEIDVIPPHRVSSYADDHGGRIDDLGELADAVNADYLIHVQIDNFDYREANSPNLFRGRCSGQVVAYEVEDTGGRTGARQIYSKSFTSVYPTHQPVSVEDVSATVFRKKYLDRIADELSRLFYKHRTGTGI